MRLYLRIKRRAGENGVCWESTENMVKSCCMSAGSVSKAKKELKKAGLIEIQTKKLENNKFGYHEIKIVDIWEKNKNKYISCSNSEMEHSQTGSHIETKNNPNHHKIKKIQRSDEADHTTSSSEKIQPIFSSSETKKPAQSVTESKKDTIKKSRIKHPSIELIKRITGYYPRRNNWDRIIDLLGDSINEDQEAKVKLAFDTWTANGHNPMNIKGWLFDWYRTDMYYVPPTSKFSE